MDTQCTEMQLEFQADFDGGHVTSDGGALLLREMDARLGLTKQFAQCFTDYRAPGLIEHSVDALLGQRIYGIALGYEDLNDHNDLLRDPLFAMALGKEDVEGKKRRRNADKGKALASASTLNRVELTRPDADGNARYKKVVYHPEMIEALFPTVFLDSHTDAPQEVILDFDATDDPIHGDQEAASFMAITTVIAICRYM